MADARANRFGLWRGLNKRCRVTDIFQASCSERCRIRPLCCGRNKPILVIEKTVLRIWVESSPNPRSEMPQFEQAGFLTYSRIKNLPDLVMDWGSGMSLSFDTLSGNYSSGTVRDFHPIPFSSGMPVGWQDTCYGTKIVFLYGLAKVFPFYLLSFNTRVSDVMMFIRWVTKIRVLLP